MTDFIKEQFENKETDDLLRQFSYLVDVTVNKKYSNPSFLNAHMITKDEIHQLGLIGLYNAIESFDVSKGSKFQTYAINHINWYIMNNASAISLRSENNSTYEFGEISSSLDSTVEDSEGEEVSLHETIQCDKETYQLEDHINLTQIKKRSEKIHDIVCKKLQGYTNKEIAEEYNVTHQNISKLLRENKQLIIECIQPKE